MAFTKGKELAPQRWAQLLQTLERDGAVRVDGLVVELGVSPATVRRDLEELEQRGRLRRVHGGAVPAVNLLEEQYFDDKMNTASAAKRAVAEAALRFVRKGETIYLDGGSTLLYLARLLRDREDLTVVTNSLRAATELAGGGPRLILSGGELRRKSQTMVGALTEPLLERLRLDKAFMGTIGLSVGAGLTTTDPGEAQTKRLVMRLAREVVLLADGGKVNQVTFAAFGEIGDVDRLVIDAGADEVFLEKARASGVEVVLAGATPGENAE